MRKLIAAMKMSIDGKIEGPSGAADWVQSWSDDYGLTTEIDACVVGGRMYPGYEGYWTAIQTEPDKPVWITGAAPTPAELEWAQFAARTPHFVLSRTLTEARWPNTRFIQGVEDIAALKKQTGKSIYLMGGAHVTASLIKAGLVNELRLIVYPLIAGEGKALFAMDEHRRALVLRKAEQRPNGCVSLIYEVSA